MEKIYFIKLWWFFSVEVGGSGLDSEDVYPTTGPAFSFIQKWAFLVKKCHLKYCVESDVYIEL